MATTGQRDRHARRLHEADAQLLVSVAVRAAVELALWLALRTVPAPSPRPAVEAAVLVARLLIGECAVRAIARPRG